MAGGPLFDPESGLASDSLIRFIVSQRIDAARERCDELWVAVLSVRAGGESPATIGQLLGDALDDADAIGRLVDGRYLALFDQRQERAVLAATTHLRSLAEERLPGTVLHAGVASYPRHGFNLDEVLIAAATALAEAQSWPIHRVEVAPAP
jgi:hypothetical protein